MKLLRLVALVVAALAFGREGTAQSAVLFSEDFESGFSGWTVTNFGPPPPLWHLSPNGGCGAVTAMAAYNRAPTDCSYGVFGVANAGELISPAFTLTGPGPFLLTFDSLKDMEANNTTAVYLADAANPTVFHLIADSIPNTATPTPTSAWLPSAWSGVTVQLQFVVIVDPLVSPGFGWMVDNIVVRNSPWTDLGFAKAGSSGLPTLVGSGVLTSSSANSLLLSNAKDSSTATLVFGPSAQLAPFKGGVLVPSPQLLVSLTTTVGGSASLPFTLPAVPPGFELYFQFWIRDAGASLGLSSSNALKGTTS